MGRRGLSRQRRRDGSAATGDGKGIPARLEPAPHPSSAGWDMAGAPRARGAGAGETGEAPASPQPWSCCRTAQAPAAGGGRPSSRQARLPAGQAPAGPDRRRGGDRPRGPSPWQPGDLRPPPLALCPPSAPPLMVTDSSRGLSQRAAPRQSGWAGWKRSEPTGRESRTAGSAPSWRRRSQSASERAGAGPARRPMGAHVGRQGGAGPVGGGSGGSAAGPGGGGR